jgi:uncharacterized protein YndB with AHSA1/START domain
MNRFRTVATLAASCALAGVLTIACASPQTAAAPATPAPTTTAVGVTAPGAAPTCAGQGVNPAAQIRYRAERVIPAPLDVVWNAHTDVAAWPAWQTAVVTNELLDPGPLAPGSRFRWTTPVPETPLSPATTLTITSTVQQVEPQRCIRWTGPAEGPGLRIDEGVHVWTFEAVPGGTRVVTEETHAGAQVEQDVPLATRFLGAGLEAWADALSARAQATAPAGG